MMAAVEEEGKERRREKKGGRRVKGCEGGEIDVPCSACVSRLRVQVVVEVMMQPAAAARCRRSHPHIVR
jgi:hypothetical protein